MKPISLANLKQGINRLKVKGGANPSSLYDLVNAYITQEGSIVPREGTIRAETLDATTVGLVAIDGIFNVFATALESVPSGYQCNILLNPTNPALALSKIWFAQPFMGFPYVVAQFSDGSVWHYWLQSGGTWEPNTVYTTGAIVTPLASPNGLAYQAVRDMAPNSLWQPQVTVAQGTVFEPNEYTGYSYRAVTVEGSAPHTGSTEPAWPTVPGGVIQEFGDFDTSSTDAGTTQGSTTTSSAAVPLGGTLTDRYGDSSTIASAGTTTTSKLPTTASQTVTIWAAGTLYATGAVVKPSTGQGAFVNAIPNGDFENGNDGSWVLNGSWEFSSSDAYQGNECVEFPASFTTGGAEVVMTNFSTITPGQSVTVTGYLNPNNSGANLSMRMAVRFYDATDTFISETQSANQEGGGWRQVGVTAVAPANAAHVRAAIWGASGTTSKNAGFADLVSWNLETAAAVSNFLYEAIQASPASSGSTEPVWPTTSGDTVVDGGVTWQAIGTSIITWQAVPIMLSGGSGEVATLSGLTGGINYVAGTYNNVPLTGGSGSGATANITVTVHAVTAVTLLSGGAGYGVGNVLSADNANLGGLGSGFTITVATVSGSTGEPTWPTSIGTTVNDSSTFTTSDGAVTNTSLSWIAIDRHIGDTNNPQTKAVCLGASHVFAGNKDITSYSAAVNPTDWTSANNAGYLPTGLNIYGNNPVAVLALYRSNLVVFNAGGYQMWQIDPDPANMALLDGEPVGSIYVRSAQSVANDLLILTEVGVRNIALVGATANLQVGNTGQPVDAIVKAQLKAGTYDPISLYYPGRGQYWLIFGPQAIVLTINGQGLKTWSRYIFPDTITDWTLNAGILYLRTAGNLVWQFDESTLVDDFGGADVGFSGIIQWPYVDLGPIGYNKSLAGIDLVGDGQVTIQIGFNQSDKTSFNDNAGFSTSQSVTPPYTIAAADTVPGTPIPIPITAPSYTVILTFGPNQAWTWEASSMYFINTSSQAGGATGP